MSDFVDERYKNGQGLRFWPETELVRFVGRTYGATHGQARLDSDLKALDLGCGTGRNSWLLYEAGFQVYGCDDSMEAIAVAMDYINSRFPLSGAGVCLEGNDLLTQLQLEDDATYDLVIDCQTIQHLSDEDHVKAYLEIARVLKSGGRFWTMHWREGHAQALYDGHYPELHDWSLATLGPMIESCGLRRGGVIMVSRAMIGDEIVQAHHYCLDWVKP